MSLLKVKASVGLHNNNTNMTIKSYLVKMPYPTHQIIQETNVKTTIFHLLGSNRMWFLVSLSSQATYMVNLTLKQICLLNGLGLTVVMHEDLDKMCCQNEHRCQSLTSTTCFLRKQSSVWSPKELSPGAGGRYSTHASINPSTCQPRRHY